MIINLKLFSGEAHVLLLALSCALQPDGGGPLTEAEELIAERLFNRLRQAMGRDEKPADEGTESVPF